MSESKHTAGAFHDALSKAGLEYSALSCNGVNLFGDHESIEAARGWLHAAGIVPQLRNALAKAISLSTPSEDVER